MTENSPGVVLVTDDPCLLGVVERHKPAAAALLRLRPAQPEPSATPSAAQWWIDLDGPPPNLPASATKRVYFYSRLPSDPTALPPGLFIRKPCTPSVAALLWAGSAGTSTECAAVEEQPGGDLPGWLAGLHVHELHELCRRSVRRLSRRLGYREASLYLHDCERGELTLAEASCSRPLERCIRLSPEKAHLMVAVARRGQRAQADDVARLYEMYDVERPRHELLYAAGSCLIAPLISGQRLWGVLNLCDRVPGVQPLDERTLDAVLDFLARSLRYACEFDRAQREARIDGLTGLHNYRWMVETLAHEIQRADRYGSALSIFTMDLDGLKSVNDRCGHLAGDMVLRHVACKIRSGLRQIDSAARTGGDEFVVLLPSTTAAGAQLVADRIVRSLQEECATFRRVKLPVSASTGVAQWQPGWDVERLLEEADRAMYAAKRAARDRAAPVNPANP